MKRLEGKTAIVTGAARGTGEAIARLFVAEGARVLLGDVLTSLGQKLADELGEAAEFVPLDVSRETDWEQTVSRALALHGRIDVLVNNAAILHLGPLESTSPETFRRILEVNTVGPFLGLRGVLDPMRAQGGGTVVNIGSIDSLLPLNGLSAYAASKWGLRGLSKTAAMELGRAGIRVNSVCPSGGNSEMFAPWLEPIGTFQDEVESYTSDRGIPGPSPFEAIAEAALFLASDASSHCTGVDLPVDGGAHAGRFVAGFNRL
ncbi:SDR family oxidoreductase [Myxococcota bacterium]|nr:SDR family oxidoreductase [Myxococcota bacterium]